MSSQNRSNLVANKTQKVRPNSQSSLSSSTADSEKIEKLNRMQKQEDKNKDIRLNDHKLNMDTLKKSLQPETTSTKQQLGKRAMVVDHSLKDHLYHNPHSPSIAQKYSVTNKTTKTTNTSFTSKQRSKYSDKNADKLCTRILDYHLPPTSPIPLKGVNKELYDVVLAAMKARAAQGQCLVRSEEFACILSKHDSAQLNAEKAKAAEKVLVNAALVVRTDRLFCEGAVQVGFVRLVVEVFSVEALAWVLKSMEVDKMLPSEKNIQNRVKEYYDLRVSIDALTRRVKETNEIATKRPVVATFLPEQQFDEQKNVCNFQIWPATKQTPQDQDKVGVDEEATFRQAWLFLLAQFSHGLRPVDFETQGYVREERMTEIISSDSNDKGFLQRNLKPDEKVQISGGKQGCACFLKYCGPSSVRALSIGRLNAQVQQMLDIDSLRQDSTCLVLTFQEKHKGALRKNTPELRDLEQRDTLSREYDRLVVRLVSEYRDEGVSLAQLPILVRQKQGKDIDVKFLGQAKLKDFIARNGQLEIYNKGPNQPHVRLLSREEQTTNQMPIQGSRSISRKSSRDSLNTSADCAHEVVDKVLDIIKMHLFQHITLADIVDTFESMNYRIHPDTVRTVVENHLSSYVEVTPTGEDLIIRLKSDSPRQPFGSQTMESEIHTVYSKLVKKARSEGFKTPSNDMSQMSDSNADEESSSQKLRIQKGSQRLELFEVFGNQMPRFNSSQTASIDQEDLSDSGCEEEVEEVADEGHEEQVVASGVDLCEVRDSTEFADSSSLTQQQVRSSLNLLMDLEDDNFTVPDPHTSHN